MNITQINTARYHGLNLTDLHLLLLLAENGRTCMTDLSIDLGLTESAITGTARKLIAKHLIQRADLRGDIPRDRRVIMLELAELGRVRIHQITGFFPQPMQPAAR